MNLFFGKACPPSSLFNKVDSGRVYASDDGQRVGRYSSTQCSSNMNNLSLCQLVPRSILTVQINKPGAPLMSGVVGQSNPFKVFWPIVQFVAVDVIYRKAIGVAKDISNCNQSMHSHFGTLIAKFCRHLKVAPAVQSWRKNFFFVDRAKMLDCPVFVSSCVGRPSGAQDAAILAHNPVNAFFVNIYFFHAVNNTAQHG